MHHYVGFWQITSHISGNLYLKPLFEEGVCVGGGYLSICTGVQPMSPYKALSNAEYFALLKLPVLTKLSNQLQRRTEV